VAATRGRILALDEAIDLSEQYRRQGQRVVLTNGVFDILHLGHAECLAAARALGDVLFVAVNGDKSASRLKGPGRPIVPACERALLVSYLAPVDHVLLFEELTADGVLRALRPHVYVKGGDYTLETLPEAAVAASVGAEVCFIPIVADLSSSKIIGRVVSRFKET
jgi:rfaE bifunctional protein nucleotidyltransferase chain/domain